MDVIKNINTCLQIPIKDNTIMEDIKYQLAKFSLDGIKLYSFVVHNQPGQFTRWIRLRHSKEKINNHDITHLYKTMKQFHNRKHGILKPLLKLENIVLNDWWKQHVLQFFWNTFIYINNIPNDIRIFVECIKIIIYILETDVSMSPTKNFLIVNRNSDKYNILATNNLNKCMQWIKHSKRISYLSYRESNSNRGMIQSNYENLVPIEDHLSLIEQKFLLNLIQDQ